VRLTVAIPTYNRNQVLRESLAHLLPQLTDRCELLISDNHSDVPVEETLRDFLSDYPQVTCRILRNRLNLGPTANFMRCFEMCETEWLWLLGDDDHPAPDAVSKILRALDSRPDCVFFHFALEVFQRKRTVFTAGLREFVHSFDSWSSLLFMSVGVYHRPTVLPNLRYGYHFGYSLAPHIVLVLASLGDRGACCFSDDVIVGHQSPMEWSPVSALLGKMILLDLPLQDDVRRELARKLRWRPSLEAIAVMLVKSARQSGDWRAALYQYDQICSRVYYGDRRLLRTMRILAYRFLVRFPSVGYRLLAASLPLLARVTKFNITSIEGIKVPDRFERT